MGTDRPGPERRTSSHINGQLHPYAPPRRDPPGGGLPIGAALLSPPPPTIRTAPDAGGGRRRAAAPSLAKSFFRPGTPENRNRHVAMSTDPLLQASFARASPGRSDRRGPRLPGGVPGTGITLYLTVTSPRGGPRDACNSSPFLALDARSRGSGERGKWSPFWWALEPWVSPGLDGSQPSSPPRSAADPPVRVLVDMLRCRFGDSSLNHYGTGPTDPVPRPRDSWTCRQGYSSTCLHRSVRPLPALFDPLSRCGPSRPAPVLGSAPGGHGRRASTPPGPRGGSGSEGAGVTWSEEWLLAG